MSTPDSYSQVATESLDFLNERAKELIHSLLVAQARTAWQDGHDTALINGQSENPYEQEDQ